MMKKGIVLMMALIFALGLTSMVFAADEKLPVDVKATPEKMKQLPPGAGPEEKLQMQEAQKPAAVKKKATVETPAPGLGPEEKGQIADTKKKATVKKKAKKPGPPPGLGPEEKQQMEDAKKPSTADKMKKKEAAPAAAPAAPAAAPAPDKK